MCANLDLSLAIPAFIAGILTFLTPCTLPLVPGYLGFISGTSIEDLKNPEKAKEVRWKIFLNGAFFIIGFSLVFIAFGILAGFAGRALVPYRIWLTRIGGIFVILFGLFMLNILKLPFLQAEKQIHVAGVFKRGRPVNSMILGSAFGFGWTPCVGPILGSVLLLASTSATALKGAVLLLFFSLGLAIPFLLIAVSIGGALRYIEKFARYLNVISIIGGIFLIILGILLFTNNMGLLTSYGFELFKFIEYEKLLDYL